MNNNFVFFFFLINFMREEDEILIVKVSFSKFFERKNFLDRKNY